jgi:transposase
MIGALSITGVRALMTVIGATTKEVFERFLKKHLLPVLKPGEVVVWDGLAAHKAKGMRELVHSVGADVILLPAYSPDLNPIEECWSKVKGILRSASMRTVDALTIAAKYAAREVTEADARGWFTHSGYATQAN